MQLARSVIGVTTAVAAVLITTAFVSPADAATTAAAAPSATATPSSTPSASASPSATPSATSAPDDTATTDPADPGADGTPSLAEQNAAGNHVMGAGAAAAGAVQAAPSQTPTSGLGLRSLAATTGPSSAYTRGFDVSAWQPNSGINWTAAYNAGARFAYIKATEGTSYTSSQFSSQWASATSAGFVRGAYVFATPDKASGAATANYLLAHGGRWTSDGKTLPPLLDIENNPYGATCYGLSQAAMVAWIQQFSNTILSATGRTPAIYTNISWWKSCTGNSAAFSKNPYMPAYWPSSDFSSPGTLGASWKTWTIWQWDAEGQFPGDQDVFNGGVGALQTFAKGGGSPVSPAQPNTGATTTLATNATLSSGGQLQSQSLQYRLTMQSDGNLVQYWGGKALWSTQTSGNPGSRAVMQSDGNLVVYSAANRPLWYTSTTGANATLNLGVEGNITVKSGSTALWTHTADVSQLGNGITLTGGQSIHPPSNLQQAVMQTDGNFVVYLFGKAAWSTKTSGNAGARLVMQTDGNLVVYSKSNKAIWNSRTSGQGNSVRLVMQPDDNMVLYKGSKALWATYTK